MQYTFTSLFLRQTCTIKIKFSIDYSNIVLYPHYYVLRNRIWTTLPDLQVTNRRRSVITTTIATTKAGKNGLRPSRIKVNPARKISGVTAEFSAT